MWCMTETSRALSRSRRVGLQRNGHSRTTIDRRNVARRNTTETKKVAVLAMAK